MPLRPRSPNEARATTRAPIHAALSIVAFALAASATPACSTGRDDVAMSDADLAEHAIFTHSRAGSGTAAGWFDRARGAVFSLERRFTDRPRWIEQRWDGAAWTTTADFTASDPDATPRFDQVQRADVATSYDTDADRLLLLTRQALWSWRDGAFTKLPASSLPALGNGFAAAFDSGRHRLVVVGASGTWEWDGASFVEVPASSSSPAPRSGARMAYDASRERVVLVGGRSPLGRTYRDTWEWDGIAWTLRASDVPTPSCPTSGLVDDPQQQRLVLFGYHCGVRAWDGSAWSETVMPTTWPGLGYGGLVAYDAVRQHAVLWSAYDGTTDLGFSSGPNQAPTLDPVASRSVFAGELVTERVVAADPDGDETSLALLDPPPGASLSAGVLRWTPGFDQLGAHELTFTANDGSLSATRTATFTVVEPSFAASFPRGPIHLAGSTRLAPTQTDSRTNGFSEDVTGSTLAITCTLSGDNPTHLEVTCTGSGTYQRQSDPFGPYAASPVAFAVTGVVRGDGGFGAELLSPGLSAHVTGKLVGGAVELDDVHCSVDRRFPSGWLGNTILSAVAPVVLPLAQN